MDHVDYTYVHIVTAMYVNLSSPEFLNLYRNRNPCPDHY